MGKRHVDRAIAQILPQEKDQLISRLKGEQNIAIRFGTDVTKRQGYVTNEHIYEATRVHSKS